MLKNRFLRPLHLSTHAAIVSLSLLFLILLLGMRAYGVAKRHFAEMQELIHRDLRAQSLLVHMDSIMTLEAQAQRKFKVTRDPMYAVLVERHQNDFKAALAQLTDTLGTADPELAFSAAQMHSSADLRNMRDHLNQRREEKLRNAHAAAGGLLKLILISLLLSIGVMAWLLNLFYRGLRVPLAHLEEATTRIRQGELSHRIPSPSGVLELRKLADSFNSMAAKLESLDQAKTEFLQTISHEIKNPLAAIKEGLNVLAHRWESLSPAARGKGFAACLIASKRLESMINNLLNHSRMDAGFFQFDLTQKNLTEAIEAAIEAARALAEKRSMQIRYDGLREIPSAFNWNGMVHVFENLLLNAIKYGRENSIIDVTATQTRSHAREFEITVSNCGDEIPETELSKLFDRFYRGSNSNQQQGLGLGLHVVKRIIEAHHGRVDARSEAGKNHFRVLLPGHFSDGYLQVEGVS